MWCDCLLSRLGWDWMWEGGLRASELIEGERGGGRMNDQVGHGVELNKGDVGGQA